MGLNLSRPLLCIDIEASGKDPETEAIWEIGYAALKPDGGILKHSRRFRPWKPLPPEVEELCKVTNAELEGEPPLSEHIGAIVRFMANKDWAGYNIRSFDLPILDAEARRSGLKLGTTGVHIVDAFSIFRLKHQRQLVDAVRLYCGEDNAKEFAAKAHGAGADSAWTLEVLREQTSAHHHPDLAEMSVEQLAKFCLGDDGREYVDLAGKLYRDKDGDVCFGFGKERDRKVKDAVGYANWMLRQSFPGSTIEALTAELERLGL